MTIRNRSPLARIVAFGVAGAACAAVGTPVAGAAPDPCAASEIAKTVGNVAINTSMYLDSHPRTNQVLTAVAGQPAGPQSLATLKAYFDANPQAATDLQVIQRPVTVLTSTCNLPISLPQVLGLVQGAQQGAGAAPRSDVPGIGTGTGTGTATQVLSDLRSAR